MSISVVDLNEEAREEQPAPAIEEAEEQPDIANEVVDTSNEIVKEKEPEQPTEQAKAKPKAKPKASDIVNCPDCLRI